MVYRKLRGLGRNQNQTPSMSISKFPATVLFQLADCSSVHVRR